jgi:hypothetical protein
MLRRWPEQGCHDSFVAAAAAPEPACGGDGLPDGGVDPPWQAAQASASSTVTKTAESALAVPLAGEPAPAVAGRRPGANPRRQRSPGHAPAS